MIPVSALEIMVQALAEPHDTGTGIDAWIDAGPILNRLSDIINLGGEERVRDAATALTLAQRRAVTKWLDALDRAAQLVRDKTDLSEPKSGGGLGERALDRALKLQLATKISSEQHRERLLMSWRHLRKSQPPVRAFVYFMAAVLGRLHGPLLAEWTIDIFDQPLSAEQQVGIRGSIQVISLVREMWDQRQAQSVKALLKPRRRVESPEGANP